MIRTIRTSAHQLGAIPDGSVQAVITSPPYYGLRSYAGEQDVEWPTVTYRLNEWCEPVTVEPWRGPLGLEPSPVAYIGHLILCLREWRRVLRDDGVCFVNFGDSYANSAVGQSPHSGLKAAAEKADGNKRSHHRGEEGVYSFASGRRQLDGLKPKDLLGIPWMFAFAARADGWWLRSEIIWNKPNPMPESVTDRPTKAHEQIFLLTKSARYYWDNEAVREEPAGYERKGGTATYTANGSATHGIGSDTLHQMNGNGRNIRTVWTIATQPYPGAHYAVWPQKLVEPMIRAATSERGCCPTCGAPWRRVVEKENLGFTDRHHKQPPGYDAKSGHTNGTGKTTLSQAVSSTTLGWSPTCTCDAGEPVPCTVLDPFAGSGTTGRVAASLGRAAILCDVSGEYLENHVPERTTVQIGLPQL